MPGILDILFGQQQPPLQDTTLLSDMPKGSQSQNGEGSTLGASILAGFSPHSNVSTPGTPSSVPTSASRAVTRTVKEQGGGDILPVGLRRSTGGQSAPAASLPALGKAASSMGGASSGSPLGGAGDFLASLQPLFLGMSMGQTPAQSLGYGGYMMSQNREAQKTKAEQKAAQNQTVQWLTGQGMGAAEASYLARDPKALAAWHKQWTEGRQPDWQIQSIYDAQGREQRVMMDKNTGQFNVIGGAKSYAGEGQTADQKEYLQAKKEGFGGTLMDYQIKMKEAGRNQVNIDTGVKLPSGFRWKDANDQSKGVEPIPGGPAEQVSAEVAARVGLGNDAVQQIPSIQDAAKRGDLTGPLDWAAGKLGYGEQGRMYREIDAASEALTRQLTGAGMNQAEIEREVSLYKVNPWDSGEAVANKLSQLKRRLDATSEVIMRGRGGNARPEAQQPQVRRYNPATGALE